MTLVNISDNFNRSNGPLNVSGGSWVANQTGNPQIVSNQLVGNPTGSSIACWKEGNPGPQTAELTIVNVGTGVNNRVGLVVAVEDLAGAPGTTVNWFATTARHYRFSAKDDNYSLQIKRPTETAYDTIAGQTWAHVPANGEKMKLTWNPATGALECFVDTGSGYVSRISYTDPSPLPASQTRIGFVANYGATIDDFSASWDVPTTADYNFYEYTLPGGTPTETLLNASWWDGTTEQPLNASGTFEYLGDDTSNLPLQQPIWSEDIRDGTGITIHYKFSNNSGLVYSAFEQCTAYALELNVGWVRDRLLRSGQGAYSTQMSQAAILQANNIGSHWGVTLGETDWETTSASDLSNVFGSIAANPSWRVTVAGPNEPNDGRVANWVTELLALAGRIKTARDAQTPGIPIVAGGLKDAEPSLPEDFAALAATNINTLLDIGDYHRYPLNQVTSAGDPSWTVTQPDAGERTPEYLQQLRLTRAIDAYGVDNDTMFCTEGGFSTDLLAWNSGPKKLPDDIHAAYVERLIMSLLTPTRWGGIGIKRFFLFELLDDPDPNHNQVQAHWGQVFTPELTSSTWTRKPSFYAIKDLMAKVSDVGGGYHPDTNPYPPASIRMEVACSDSRFRYCIVGKRNGEVRLFYWLDKALWRFDNNLPFGGERINSSASPQTYTKIGEIPSTAWPGGQILDGLSGSCESRAHTNAMWLHMERPNSYMWLVDNRNLTHKKTIQLMLPGGTTPFADGEWEDCAYDTSRNAVWVAECGANNGQTQFEAAYFSEPTTLGSASSVLQVQITARYIFRYATGASLPASGLNCETMLVDPTGRIYFVDKRSVTGDGGPIETTLWQAPATLAAYPSINTLTPVRNLGSQVGSSIGRATRGDWHPTDNYFVIADNFNDQLNTPIGAGETDPRIWEGHKFDGTTFDFIETVDLPVARKINAENNVLANPTNENFHFSSDGRAAWVGTEGTPPTEIWRTDFASTQGTSSPVTVTLEGSSLSLSATPYLQDVVIVSP